MSLPCKHWRDCGVEGGGCCNIGVQDTPSIGWCLTQCTKYDGPDRGNIGNYFMWNQDVPLPSHHKQRHAQILVSAPHATAYIGDRMGAAIGKMTGRKPCKGCRKVEDGLNLVHRGVRKLVGIK